MPAAVSDMSTARSTVLAQVAAHITAGARIGIDGVDGAGKTRFAEELAAALRGRGVSVVRVSIDDFHQPRAIRYRAGRDSAPGYWADAFDYPRLWLDVLTPLGPEGSRRYRPRAHELVTDVALDPAWLDAAADAVLVLDGVFLQRPELTGGFDTTIFLDVRLDEAARRLAARDGTAHDPAASR